MGLSEAADPDCGTWRFAARRDTATDYFRRGNLFGKGGARYRSDVLRARSLDTRGNPFHLVFAVEF